MNELKKYALDQISKFNPQKPSTYDESTYRRINGMQDIEYYIKYAENVISSSERESNAAKLPDNNERDLAVYNAYVGIKKAAVCMSDIVLFRGKYDSITREEFDGWCHKLHDLIKRCGEQNSRYISRPDG